MCQKYQKRQPKEDLQEEEEEGKGKEIKTRICFDSPIKSMCYFISRKMMKLNM